MPDVVIAAHWFVFAEGRHIPAHSRRHAQAWIPLDIIRADAALKQPITEVAFLGHRLARAVVGDRVWAVLLDCFGKLVGHQIHRYIPAHRHELAILAEHRSLEPIFRVNNLGKEQCLGTDQALGGWMLWVTTERNNFGCPCARSSHHSRYHRNDKRTWSIRPSLNQPLIQ